MSEPAEVECAFPIVIFGASGFLGRHLTSHPTMATTPSYCVSRRSDHQSARHDCFVQGDLRFPDPLIGKLPSGATVVNLAYDWASGHARNLEIADGLLKVARAIRAARVVHFSTAMVAGRVQERWASETTPCHPVTSYQRTKLAVEERLCLGLAGTCPLVIVRPTAVFGSGGRNLEKLTTDLLRRPKYENYLRSCLFGERPMNLVPVETVVAAAHFAVAAPVSQPSTLYIVADDEVEENNFQWVEACLMRALAIPTYRLPRTAASTALLRLALRVVGKSGVSLHLRFSSQSLETAGFKRPVTFLQALHAFAAERAARVLGVDGSST